MFHIFMIMTALENKSLFTINIRKQKAVLYLTELENEMSDTCNSETSQPQTDNDTCSSNGIQVMI